MSTATVSFNMSDCTEAGHNLKYVQKGDLLILVINVKDAGVESSTGKMQLVAKTSGGFTPLATKPALRANINVGFNKG